MRRHAGRRRLRVPVAGMAAVAAGAAFVAAAVTWTSAPAGQAPAGLVEVPAETAPSPWDEPTADARRPSGQPRGAQQRRTAPEPGAGRPVGMAVPSLGIDAPVVPVALDGTALEPPADPQVLGWWSGGAVPGAGVGTALVTGHTVHDGGGAMDDLEQVRPGAVVRVSTQRGTLEYVVRSVRVLDKAALARRAHRLFSQEVAGRLVLVTCEDWDGTGYLSNVVVTARPR